MNTKEYQAYLRAEADKIDALLLENPTLGIAVDPDVAEFMGAFEENDHDLSDLDYQEMAEIVEGVNNGNR